MLVNNTYPPRPHHPSPVLPPPNSLQQSLNFHYGIYSPSAVPSHSPSLSHSPPQPLSAYGSPCQTPSPVSRSYPSHMDAHVAVAPVGHHRSSSANVVPSPPTSCPSASVSSLRYEIILEAPTAAAQKVEDSPLTYLNKGQFYSINLKDMDSYDGDIRSTVIIMFHDESHRKVAPNYWKFWLSQQKNQHSARALDIDANRSNGIHNVECNYFDRVSFQWNGKLGANIYIRFNCLSTDFSRIKGVKGIPLRLHMESHLPSDTPGIEKSYCRIKLFRDKGAERKNKDDAKHIEKQLEKLRGKNGETHPFWLAYSQTAPYTVFCDVPSSPIAPPTTLSDIEYARRLSDSSSSTASRDHHHPHHSMMYGAHLQPQPPPPHAAHSAVTGMMLPPVYSPSKIATKRPYPVHAYHHHQTPTSLISPPADPSMATAAAAAAAVAAASSAANGIHDAATATPGPPPYYPMPPSAMHLDMDPTYVPQRRRRIAKLCIFAKFPTETHHRAVYLEQLTLQDLKVKLLDKMMKPDQDIKEIVRYVANKENVVVHVDDTFIQDIPEEQDMEVDLHANDDGSYTLALRY